MKSDVGFSIGVRAGFTVEGCFFGGIVVGETFDAREGVVAFYFFGGVVVCFVIDPEPQYEAFATALNGLGCHPFPAVIDGGSGCVCD